MRTVDVIFSSGFLCFSSHAGCLQALEKHAIKPSAVVGTSSGALAASMLAAGLSADEIADVLSAQRPISLVRPSATPWRGPLSTRALMRRMRDVLPGTFAELPVPLALGVYRPGVREPLLLTDGDLPSAVAASCAVPRLFSPVAVGGTLFADGGAVDRTMASAWRAWRPEGTPALVHLVSDAPDGEFGPRDGVGVATAECVHIVRSARAKASFLSLKDFEGERSAACAAVERQLDGLGW